MRPTRDVVTSTSHEYVVTGAVLLLAAGFDAVVRRRRAG
jgi:ABC-type xylose transport system permease subunit